MRLDETNDTIELYSDDMERESPIYQIPKDRLLEVVYNNVSDWITHLLNKTWIEYEILYKIAAIIVREHPENTIDWDTTFFMVEKKYYLDHVNEIKEEFTSKKRDFFDRIETGQEETNPFTSEEISAIVDRQLKKFHIK